jgi:hypothetical protein
MRPASIFDEIIVPSSVKRCQMLDRMEQRKVSKEVTEAVYLDNAVFNNVSREFFRVYAANFSGKNRIVGAYLVPFPHCTASHCHIEKRRLMVIRTQTEQHLLSEKR